MSLSAFWYGSVTARRSRCSPVGLIRTTRRPLTGATTRTDTGRRRAGLSSDTRRANRSFHCELSSGSLLPSTSTQTRSTGTSAANVSICSASARYHSCSVRIGT